MADTSYYNDSACAGNQRKSISTRTRFEVFKRDHFTCQYCGAQPPEVVLHVDHILAVANGGDNDTSNLTTACQKCNLGKSAVPLSVIPKSLEDTAAEAAEMMAQVEAHAQQVRASREALEDAAWGIAEILEPGASEGWSHNKFNGVSGFVERLGYAVTFEAARIAESRYPASSRRFKYFCGICWNRVREGES